MNIHTDNIRIDQLHQSITDINLCVHFTPQGICDEQGELGVKRVPRQRNQVDPPRANHFSLWLGFGGADVIMLDAIPGCPTHDSADSVDPRSRQAFVRLSAKSIPSDDDIGCVLREFNIREGTTTDDIMQLCIRNGRHLYSFLPVHKQQVGCRHWIHLVSQDLERAGIVGHGFGDDVLEFLKTYYNRYPYQNASRRWDTSGNWGPRKSFARADIGQGSFHGEVNK
ncbi:hypothetical protein BDZ94DRAFT_1248546 [Collybia nuda]|uniref:DUF7770 domain-containing protein n=1 Tax=Collybia nuda TaxID=64659 RepID=A0A9P5YGV5_9AGAR|nr:hypothetical protein BDZ94DRAFT_1248546 [Collybia nuda]